MKPHSTQQSALIYLSVSAAIHHEASTATDLARRALVSNSALSGLSRGDRPTPATVGALCRAVRDSRDAADILCAHLLDEVIRAGLAPSSVRIRPTGRSVAPAAQQIRLDRIAAAASYNPALARLIECLETLALQAPYCPAGEIAADPDDPYTPNPEPQP